MPASSNTLTAVEKIRDLSPMISELLAISGSPCLSIGVLHHNEVIYTNHRGKRDISKDITPDNNTIYRIASLTKLLTAAAIALLVEERQIHWDTRINEILPDFNLREDDIGRKATLIDVLSHRTGLSLANAFWGQCILGPMQWRFSVAKKRDDANEL
jgi:CubicO group peptidase (beta-lactamase class C family)